MSCYWQVATCKGYEDGWKPSPARWTHKWPRCWHPSSTRGCYSRFCRCKIELQPFSTITTCSVYQWVDICGSAVNYQCDEIRVRRVSHITSLHNDAKWLTSPHEGNFILPFWGKNDQSKCITKNQKKWKNETKKNQCSPKCPLQSGPEFGLIKSAPVPSCPQRYGLNLMSCPMWSDMICLIINVSGMLHVTLSDSTSCQK